MNFYLDGYSVFVNPFINRMTSVIDNQVEQYAPDDKSSTAYNYGYNTAYAGYSFGKHFMLHANNTGTYKTTYSSEKFANSIGKTIGDVNSINNIEKDIQDQDVGYATYIADAGVVYSLYSLVSYSTMPWLTLTVSVTSAMSNFYNAHNAIKYIDNNIGISSGSAKLLSYANPFNMNVKDVGYATYIADATVAYALFGYGAIPMGSKISALFGAHNVIKYIDNKIGISSGSAKLFSYEYLPSYFSAETNESVVNNVKNNVDEKTVAKNVNINTNTKTIQSDDTQKKVNVTQNIVDVYEEIYTMNDDNEYMGLENDNTEEYDTIENPCTSDDIFCELKDDIYANSTLWN